jgi:hypothetical protein
MAAGPFCGSFRRTDNAKSQRFILIFAQAKTALPGTARLTPDE